MFLRGKIDLFLQLFKPVNDELLEDFLINSCVLDEKECITNNNICLIECPNNKFYYLLFALLAKKINIKLGIKSYLAINDSVNLSFGSSFSSILKRSYFFNVLKKRKYIKGYSKLNIQVGFSVAGWGWIFYWLYDLGKSYVLWKNICNNKSAPEGLCIDGIEIWDLIIDSYLRFLPSEKFQYDNKFIRYLLFIALRNIRISKKYFEENQVKYYFTTYTTYINHGITARVALSKNINVWSFANLQSFGKKLAIKDSYHTANTISYKKIFDELDGKQEKLKQAEDGLKRRFSGENDDATVYMTKSSYALDKERINIEIIPGSVVLFLHDFFDSPHVYENFIFNDFWEWACFTIESLEVCGEYIYVKPHPNQSIESKLIVKKLKQKYPQLKWIDISSSNFNIINGKPKYIVTAYGTISHEMAYFGIPSLCCASHPHISYDFCKTAKNKEEYRKLISNSLLVDISKKEMREQALSFYYMHNLYGGYENIETRNKYIDLWKICNNFAAKDEEIMPIFKRLDEDGNILSFINEEKE